MSDDLPTVCNQEDCHDTAAFRFTWPGHNEAGICEQHAQKLRTIAEAMGLRLQLIRLRPIEESER